MHRIAERRVVDPELFANCATGRPDFRTSATASALNSSLYRRPLAVCGSFPIEGKGVVSGRRGEVQHPGVGRFSWPKVGTRDWPLTKGHCHQATIAGSHGIGGPDALYGRPTNEQHRDTQPQHHGGDHQTCLSVGLVPSALPALDHRLAAVLQREGPPVEPGSEKEANMPLHPWTEAVVSGHPSIHNLPEHYRHDRHPATPARLRRPRRRSFVFALFRGGPSPGPLGLGSRYSP